jgi:hypothetical protein
MKLALVLVLAVTGCATDLAGTDSTTDTTDTDTDTDTSHTFNLLTCAEESWHVWLPFGSAWVTMAPYGTSCQLQLGGETENPIYNGQPTQTCLFPRVGAVTISVGSGGPAYLDDPHCSP